MRGWVLVQFHVERGRESAEYDRLLHLELPEGATIVEPNPGGQVFHAYGIHAAHALLQVEAKDRTKLREACDFIEQRFSHVDGYGI